MTIRVVILSRSRKKQFAADDHGTGTQSVQHQEQAERFEGSLTMTCRYLSLTNNSSSIPAK